MYFFLCIIAIRTLYVNKYTAACNARNSVAYTTRRRLFCFRVLIKVCLLDNNIQTVDTFHRCNVSRRLVILYITYLPITRTYCIDVPGRSETREQCCWSQARTACENCSELATDDTELLNESNKPRMNRLNCDELTTVTAQFAWAIIVSIIQSLKATATNYAGGGEPLNYKMTTNSASVRHV